MLLTLRIKDLRLRAVIGLNDWERDKKQDVIINIRFSYEASRASEKDDADGSVDYKAVNKLVISEVEKTSFRMLESLAVFILELVMREPKILEAEVEVDKPHSLRFADSVSASASARRQD